MFVLLALIAATAAVSYMIMNFLAQRRLLRQADKSAALQYALRNCHFVSARLIRRLIEEGANVNYVGPFGQTPLVAALEKGRSAAVIDELLAAGAALESDCGKRQSPLLAAIVSRSRLTVVKELLKAGADPHICLEDDDSTLLMVAAAFYHRPQLLDMLLEAGIDVNARNFEGMTALTAALCFGKYPANVERLLARGADVTTVDANGKNAADYLRGSWRLRWHPRLRRRLLSRSGSSLSAD